MTGTRPSVASSGQRRAVLEPRGGDPRQTGTDLSESDLLVREKLY